MLYATASQTVGPYLHIGLNWLNSDTLYTGDVPGERITIEGVVVDGDGAPITDGLVELWQADANGIYAHPEGHGGKAPQSGFKGFARQATDARGGFRFHTLKPGRVAAPQGGLQAPHIVVSVMARGVLKRLATRIYFPDEPANAQDPVLGSVPAARRATLIAQRDAAQPGVLRFNVVIQGTHLGQGETVFFDF